MRGKKITAKVYDYVVKELSKDSSLQHRRRRIWRKMLNKEINLFNALRIIKNLFITGLRLRGKRII